MPNRPFPSSPGPLFQNEGRCSAFDMEIIFHSHANKTHFHKKGCAPSLILKVRNFWNSEVAYFIEFFSKLTSGSVFLGTSRYEAKAGCFQIVMFNEVHQ